MKIFLTGGSGYIGRALLARFVKAGYDVSALARSPEAEEAIRSAGGRAVSGNLREPAAFAGIAAECDAVVHAGFEQKGVAVEKGFLDTLLGELDRRATDANRKHFIYTSGVWVLGNTGSTPADESASLDHPAQLAAWRPAHEKLVADAACSCITTSIIRPGIVFGGSGGICADFFATAEKTSAAIYVGDGKNHWPLIHLTDLADLYTLVLEKRAGGIYHCVDEAAPTVMELARAAGEACGKGGAVKGQPLDEARKTMGGFADALCLDQIVTAKASRKLGWKAQHKPFTESAGDLYKEFKSGLAATR